MEQVHKNYHLMFSGCDCSGDAGATITKYPRLVDFKIHLFFNNSRQLEIQDQVVSRFGLFWGHAHLTDICLLPVPSRGLPCVFLGPV